MFVEDLSLDFLLKNEFPLNSTLPVIDLVLRHNRHCEQGVPVLIGSMIYYGRPLFSSRREFLQLIAENKPLVLIR